MSADRWVMVPVEPTPEMRNAYHAVPDDVLDLKGTAGGRWAAMLAAAPAAPAAQSREPLTEEQMLACVRSVGTPVPMGLTRDRGPYEVTEPSWFLIQLVRAIERAHGIGGKA